MTTDVRLSIPRAELEVAVDVLFAEAYRRRRAHEDVPPELVEAMRRLNTALEGIESPGRFQKWLTLGLTGP